MHPEKPDDPEILTPVEARQGRLGRDVLYVLFISLSLAIVAAVVLLTWASPRAPAVDKVGFSMTPVMSPALASIAPVRETASAPLSLARGA
jgi:hypothetical protein